MRVSVVVTMSTMLAVMAGLAYFHATRDDPADDAANASARTAIQPPEANDTSLAATTPAKPSPQPEPAPQGSKPEPAPVVSTVDAVERLISDTQSTDAKTRAAAIRALGKAPKELAVPALKRVIDVGEPQVDRQIALQSLYTLALDDGDQSGMIRDALRHAIYHTDDDGVTQTAQALLEDVEAEFATRKQARN